MTRLCIQSATAKTGFGSQRWSGAVVWRRGRLLGIVVGLGLVPGLWLASRADAYVYFASVNGTISRVNLDGTSRTTLVAGAVQPHGVAVDSAHIYWTNYGTNTIGRANLGGGFASQSFITGASSPWGIAVGGDVYWTNAGNSSIGQGSVNGGPALGTVRPGGFTFNLRGAAIDNPNHLYYANFADGKAPDESIGRLGLVDGSINTKFVPGGGPGGPNGPCGLAVGGSKLYWTNNSSIGRANLDGTSPGTVISATGGGACGLAVDSAHIYWTHFDSIESSNLDGSGIHALITGITTFPGDNNTPTALAVDGLGPGCATCPTPVFPSSWTLRAAGPVSSGAIVRPVLKKRRLIGLAVFRLNEFAGKRSLVGFVPLGSHRGSKQRVRWNLNVNGKTLTDGTYEVDLETFNANGKPANLPAPRPELLVIKRGHVRITP